MYVPLVLKEERGECRQSPTQKYCVGSILCCHDRGILAKCANIWLSWQHVADMLATFPAKLTVEAPFSSALPLRISNSPLSSCNTPMNLIIQKKGSSSMLLHRIIQNNGINLNNGILQAAMGAGFVCLSILRARQWPRRAKPANSHSLTLVRMVPGSA